MMKGIVFVIKDHLEIDMPYDPAIPLLDIHTEKTRRERDTSTPMFIAALCIIGSSFIHLIRTDSNVFFLMAE